MHPKIIFYIIYYIIFNSIQNNNAYAENITAYTEESPPNIIKTSEGEVGGEVARKVHEILIKANFQPNIIIFPWKRAYDQALENKNTVIFPMGKTPEREKLFIFLVSLYKSKNSFYKLSDSENHITSLEDAKKFKICTVKDDIKTIYLKEKGFKFLEESGIISMTSRDLFNRKCDFAFGTLSFIEVSKEFITNKLTVVKDFEVLELQSDRYLAISKSSDPKIVERIMNAAKELKLDTK